MSRDKFEEHAKLRGLLITKWDDGVYISCETREAAFAWLAGRESMRDEAANNARFFAKNSATARSIVESIKSIEP